MTAKTETIIERIKKLLALSKDPSNEHQAAAAAAKAQQLLFDHNLSMTVVEAKEDSDYEKEVITVPKSDKAWRALLYHCIAQHNFCTAIDVARSEKIFLVGKKQNIEIVNYLYNYLAKVIPRLSLEAYKQAQADSDERIWSSTFRRAFSIGAVGAINTRLRKQREEAEAATRGDQRALVVQYKHELNQAVREKVGAIRNSQTRTSDRTAYAHGWAAGNNIPLHQGVTGNKQPALT